MKSGKAAREKPSGTALRAESNAATRRQSDKVVAKLEVKRFVPQVQIYYRQITSDLKQVTGPVRVEVGNGQAHVTRFSQ